MKDDITTGRRNLPGSVVVLIGLTLAGSPKPIFAQAPERSGMVDSHFRGGEVALDSPASGTAVSGQVQIAGWAMDTSPEYTGLEVTGIDAVDIYLDGAAGKGTLLGRASYGFDRADVAAAFGQARYRMSGFSLPWNTSEATPGIHTLFVYIHSVGHTWTLKEFLVRVADPNGPSAPTLTLTHFGSGRGTLRAKWVDSPSHKSPSTPEWYSTEGTRSWTYEPGARVVVTATPEAGSVFGGFIGGGCGLAASCNLEMDTAFPNTLAGAFELAGGALGDFVINTDLGSDASVSGVVSVTGYALYLGCGTTCPAGPGIDAVDLYLNGVTFIGRSTLGIPRSLAATTFLDSRFLTSGFEFKIDTTNLSAGTRGLSTSSLSPGMHQLWLYAHSVVTGAWGVTRVPLLVRTPTLQVTRGGLGSGRVTSVPAGIDTGNRMPRATWPRGTSVTLTATPDAGATFTGWSGGGCKGTLPCVVTLPAQGDIIDVTAEFARGDAPLGGGMTILLDVDDSHSLAFRVLNPGAESSEATLTGSAVSVDPAIRFDAVDVYFGGPAGQGRFLGRAKYGVTRRDRGISELTGFEITVDTTTLTPGYHDLVVYAHRAGDLTLRDGTWFSRTFRVLVAGPDVRRVWAIHVRVEGNGGGRVTSAPAGIDLRGGRQSAPIIEGTEVRLTATPDPGSRFVGFAGACKRRNDPTFKDESSCDAVTDGTLQAITAVFIADSLRPGVSLDSPTSSPIETNMVNLVGWAVNVDAPDPQGPGVDDEIGLYTASSELYVTRFDNVAGDGTFLGRASYGLSRVDVGQALANAKYNQSGFLLPWDVSLLRAACLKAMCGHIVLVNVHTKNGPWSVTPFPVTVTGGSGSTTVTANVGGSGTGRVYSTLPTAGVINTRSTQSASFSRANGNVFLVALSDPGSMFTGWTGCDLYSANQCIEVLNSAAKSVTATFTPNTQPLTVTIAGTGSGTVIDTHGNAYSAGTRTVSFATNTSVGFPIGAARPDTGSTFTGYSGACTGTTSCGVSMTGPQSVTATFTSTSSTTKQLSVTVIGSGSVTSSPAGISTPATNSATYKTGTVVTLTPTPATGSVFASWGGACEGKGACAVTLDNDRGVTATFTAVDPLLTVTVTGTGTGLVTSSPPGIAAETTLTTPSPVTKSASFTAGSPVTLTAAAGANSKFDGWGGACSGLGACVVTMDAAKSVTATFTTTTPATQTLTVTVTAIGTGVTGVVTSSPPGIDINGTASAPGTRSAPFTTGSVVTLTATPGGNSKFDVWGGACSGAGACVVTMDAAKTVTAAFSKN